MEQTTEAPGKKQEPQHSKGHRDNMSGDFDIRKAVDTKSSITAYFKGEITMKELHSRGIKFVGTI